MRGVLGSAWACTPSLQLLVVLTSLLSWVAAVDLKQRQPFAIVHPLEDHTKLEVDEAGLAVLEQMAGPVAPVVAIGPYRSGKSFLLNQLMNVTCDEGFGVGHTRLTQTKGVWMWGEPVPVTVGGHAINLLYFDTEGFESTGKADTYDDRVFALAALISQVLIYNLPEAIRESDLEKLSFAVELSKAFFGPEEQEQQGAGADPNALPIRPGHMVWLIQRDFLRGQPLDATLAEALRPVPNPHGDAGIAQLNRIRASLSHLAGNSSAIGLPQPHLDRTRLCELGDGALAPEYVQKREELKRIIAAVAQPKVVQGVEVNGMALAALVRRVVAALNQREIPTAGSLVDYFNRELVGACREQFAASLERMALPMNESDLEGAARQAEAAAMARFQRERFGTAVKELRQALQAAIEKEVAARKAANMYESSRVCEAAELACEEVLERQARQRLPSVGRFIAQFEKCSQRFRKTCVGPALGTNQERLLRAWRREEGRFRAEYNSRLLNGLGAASLLAIMLFRFVIRQRAAEAASWATFLFLQVYPKTFLGEGSMFDRAWWQWLAWAWEAVVFNPLIDLGGTLSMSLLLLALAAYLTRRWHWPRLKAWSTARTRGWLGWRRSHAAAKAQLQRDLDV